MKKMLVGFGLLAILFTLSIGNYVSLEKQLHELQVEIVRSYTLPTKEAKAALKSCLQKWESMGTYTKTILSEGKCEKISETFFESISQPNDFVLRDKLIYEINSLIESEKISFTSIF